MSDKKISQLTAATTPLAGTEVLPIVQGTLTVKVANNDLRPKQIQSNATSGVLQITGPAAVSTRVMTTPDANFTVARTDAGQTFTGTNTFDSVVSGAYQVNNRLKIGYAWIADAPGPTGNNTGFGFGGNQILPCDGTGISTNNTADLGSSNYKYKDFYLGGNVVIGTFGKGIDFSATSDATGMTSELLADYEEGTWTPTITAAAGTLTSYTIGAATYTKIGRLVTASTRFTITNAGTGAGALEITLPFTAGTSNHAGSAVETALTGDVGRTWVSNGASSMFIAKYNNATYCVTDYNVTATATYSV